MENVFTILMPVAIILLICFAAMSVKIWSKKGGKFAETEIETNTNMQKLGIKCTKQEEIELYNKTHKKKIECGDCDACFLTQKK